MNIRFVRYGLWIMKLNYPVIWNGIAYERVSVHYSKRAQPSEAPFRRSTNIILGCKVLGLSQTLINYGGKKFYKSFKS